MTVYFAAARSAAASPVARILSPRRNPAAANDNRDIGEHDRVLSATLRHFAKHGLRAAEEARNEAEAAFFAGDRENYDLWLGICRMLDKRMALDIQNETNLG